MPGQVVKVLDVDPELGEMLTSEQLRAAAPTVRALKISLPDGQWSPSSWPVEVRAGLGLLVLDGLLTRRIQLGGRFAAELLGPGDLLRPWQEDDEVASVSRSSGWRCLRDCSVALLDLEFAKTDRPVPRDTGAADGADASSVAESGRHDRDPQPAQSRRFDCSCCSGTWRTAGGC